MVAPFSLLSLCFAIASTTYASPLPLIPIRESAISSWHPPQYQFGGHDATLDQRRHNVHVDPSSNSIGVRLISASGRYNGEDVTRFWLPIGKRVYVRDNPYLPAHPVSASVFSVIPADSANRQVSSTNRATCVIYPVMNEVERLARNAGLNSSKLEAEGSNGVGRLKDQRPREPSVVVRGSDGLVDLEDATRKSFLFGREVESYECS